jgi:hypothetical protein
VPFNNSGQCLGDDAVTWNQFVAGMSPTPTPADLNCTSPDVSVASLNATEYTLDGINFIPLQPGSTVTCTEGDPIFLKLIATLAPAAPETRFDAGLWLAQGSGNAISGSCNHYNVPVSPLPAGAVNLDGDSCGDVSAQSDVVIDLGVVQTICHAGASGQLEMGTCVAWTTTSSERVCPVTSIGGADGFRAGTLPGNVSKCNCESVVVTPGAPPTGSITIVLDAVPDDPQDFAFTTTGFGLSPFSLDDDFDPTMTNVRTFGELLGGTYTVAEAGTPGFDLTSLTCTAGGSGNTSTRTATITLAPGANVTCTFVNSPAISGGSITLQTGSFTLANDALSGDFGIRNSSTGTQQVFVTSLTIVDATFRDGTNLVQATVTGCVFTPLPVVIPANAVQSIALTGCHVSPSVRKELMFTVRAAINGGTQPFYERTYKVRTQ